MTPVRAAIQAIATHLPDREITNEQLAEEFGRWTSDQILEKTGIRVRRVAGPGECASDLGVAAAQKLFASGRCRPEDIDFLLFCTQSPDYFLPATACTLQSRLGLPKHCGAIDYNQGCSGFVYGLAMGKGLIESGTVRNVLLITAETYSKHLNPRDPSTRVLFGDGAAAVLLQAREAEEELIGPFVFGSDGTGAGQLIVPSGALRCPPSPAMAVESADAEGNVRSQQNLYMNGPEIFNFTIRTLPPLVAALLQRASLDREQVDYYVFHQANRFMLTHLRKKLKIPEEKFCINMQDYGNTVSSTIPMALEIADRDGAVRSGDRIMVVGFGVGYSWAGAMVRMVE